MKAIFTVFSLVLFSLNAHAGLNKWVDGDGTVHYSDTVPPEVTTAQPVRNIAGKGQTNTSSSVPPKTLAEREADLKKGKQEKDDATSKKAQQDAEAETKKHNCEAARLNERTLTDGVRITTYDAKGERIIMDDSARSQQLEEVRKMINSSCN